MKQTVFVTGASTGIGKATAKLFAQKDWNVVATMRDPSKETELTQLSGVLVTRLDVQDQSSIIDAIRVAIERFGRIDVLCNNAGYGQYGLFEALSREKIQQQFDVNVFGVMDVTRAFLPHFREHKRGVILNTSSGGGIFTLPVISLYCASKFALEGFTESLSYELASQGITVKLVTPHGGVTNTAFGERSNADIALDPSLKDYNEFLAQTQASYGKMVAARSQSSEDIAAVMYTAATDGTDQLRYLVGNDTRGFIKAKKEMADQDYIEYMRGYFAK